MLKDFERRVDVHSVKLQSQSRENLQTIQVWPKSNPLWLYSGSVK